MKVGFHSPLPPARTGVADYSAALLRELSRLVEVALHADRADIFLYHLGNNQLHGAILERAISRPGVAVLHDAVLTHLYLGRLSEEAFVEEFCGQYGEWHRDAARLLWRERGRSGADPRFFTTPMLRRVANASRAVIVHNAEAVRRVLAEAPGARVEIVPHLYLGPESPPDAATVLAWKQRHSIAPGAPVFGLFGYLRETKRVYQVLRAFETVQAERPDAVLLVAGSFVSDVYRGNLAPWLRRPGVRTLPFLAEPDFATAAAACTACLNLRVPSAGETSGIGIRAMGLGCAVVYTEGAEVSGFPPDTCVRIPGDAGEVPSLIETLRLLASRPSVAREIGRRGREWIRRHHSPALAAKRYAAVLASAL